MVNKQVLQESTSLEVPDVQSTRQTALTRALNPMNKLAGRVSSKLEEGDYRGAVRLVCSEDVIAEHSSHIPYMPLYRLKHPLHILTLVWLFWTVTPACHSMSILRLS